MTISVKIIAHSKSAVTEKEIVTFELEYPRFIHAELMTHRLFSRNAASSRAIPIERMIELIESSPAMPEIWGSNQSGMQAGAEIDIPSRAVYVWDQAAKRAVKSARELQALGLHKQIVNRVLEPFSHMKVVLTATEFDNWWWLRKHEAAQPEIRVLAERMWEELGKSEAEVLNPGEWHTPYVHHYRDSNGQLLYHIVDLSIPRDICGGEFFVNLLSFEDALKVSASLCAQVSYRKSDDSLEKALLIYDRLVESKPVHASPFEHQATPMGHPYDVFYYVDTVIDEGSTHCDIDNDRWSGNFKHWIQQRQLIPNNACWDYKEQN